MTTKYEYYTTGDNAAIYYDNVNDRWYQTFKPQIKHTIKSVVLKLYRTNSPGYLYIDIYLADANHKPTGSILASGSLNCNAITSSAPGQPYAITLGAGTVVDVDVEYCIVGRCPGATVANLLYQRYDSSGEYARGLKGYSTDGGSTWATQSAQDFYFEEWGDFYIEAPEAQTNAADNIQQEAATLHGKVLDDGGEACSVRFEYGVKPALDQVTAWQEGKVTNDTFEAIIQDLLPNTPYTFRAIVENSNSEQHGDTLEFTTLAPPPPPPALKQVLISHPAIKDVYVKQNGTTLSSYTNLSNLDQQRIERSLKIPVPTPATIEVITLLDEVWCFDIP